MDDTADGAKQASNAGDGAVDDTADGAKQASNAGAPSGGGPATESEHIKMEGEHIKELDTMEEEEAAMR